MTAVSTLAMISASCVLPNLAVAQQRLVAASPTAALMAQAAREAQAAGAAQTTTPAQAGQPTQGVGSPDGESGFAADDALQKASLGGSDSVEEDLAFDDLNLGSLFEFPVIRGGLGYWYDAKRALNEKLGLQLQASYQSLHQWANESSEEDRAAAGRFEFQGTWTLLGRDSGNTGLISFRTEYRDAFGDNIPPSQIGLALGTASVPGTGFSSFGGSLSELSWRQRLFAGNLQFGIGKISATSWYNGTTLSAPKRGYQNSSLQSSASKATPGRGLGFVAAYRVPGRLFGFVGGIHDANARTSNNPFDTIGEGEFFKSIEFRWIPTSFDRRRWDQIRVQFWHQDERVEAGVPAGVGMTYLASIILKDRFMPWVFGGVSDGDASTMKVDFAAGVAVAFNTAHRAARDVLGFGFNWGRPSDETLRDEYNYELFYRLQLIPHLALTPSVQFIYNPAKNPDAESAWVFGLRLRVPL